MSVKNFIPAVVEKNVMREIDRELVFKEDCWTKFEGKIKNVGDVVKFLAAGKPSIRRFSDGKLHELDAPEEIQDSAISMPINQSADFHFYVDDLDKRQAEGNLYSVYMDEASKGMANEIDTYIASFAAANEALKLNTTAQLVSKDTVLGLVNSCLTKLYEKDVKLNDKITITGTPRFTQILLDAYEGRDTDNSDMLKHGRVGKYHNAIIKASNNVHTASSGAHDYIMIKTDRALGFANQITKTEAYRPDRNWQDCVKGLSVFEAKWLRPKENIVLIAKYA